MECWSPLLGALPDRTAAYSVTVGFEESTYVGV